tara:strand:- start:604 stop:1299 length:696 start_codon:yes stop_codon:yes gene_type:complete
MSFTFVSKVKSASISSSDPVTLTHTTTTSKVLAVSVISLPATGRSGGNPTFAGVTMSQASTWSGVVGIAYETFYLLNADISIGASKVLSVPNTTNKDVYVTLALYNSPSDATFESITHQSATSTSTSATNLQDGTLIVDTMVSNADTIATANNRTLLYSVDLGTEVFSNQYHIATAGNYEMTYTIPSADWHHRVLAFLDASSIKWDKHDVSTISKLNKKATYAKINGVLSA